MGRHGVVRLLASVTCVAVGMGVVAGSAAHAEMIQEPERAQMRHFSFFRTAPEGLPGWGQKIEEQEKAEEAFPNAQFLRGCDGLNAELAQKIEGIPGRRIFVIPGDGCMQMVNQGPAAHPYPMLTGVSRTEEAIKHGMQTGGFRFGFGIVPDGAIAAKLSPTLTVPVVKGTFFKVRYRGVDVASLWTKARLIYGASAGDR
jgi:hypothetical protein